MPVWSFFRQILCYPNDKRARNRTVVNEVLRFPGQKKPPTIWSGLLVLEADPYTRNLHYYSSGRDKAFSQLKSQQLPKWGTSLTPSEAQYSERIILAELQKLGISADRDDLAKLYKDKDYRDEALVLMAEAKSYFKVCPG